MRNVACLAALLAFVAPAYAQNGPPSAIELQRAISVLQGQRNGAQDQAAQCAVDRMAVTEENAKLKAELEELRKKLPAENIDPSPK